MYQKLMLVSRFAEVGSGWKCSTVCSFTLTACMKVSVLKSSLCQSKSDMIKYVRLTIRQHCKQLQSGTWVISAINCCVTKYSVHAALFCPQLHSDLCMLDDLAGLLFVKLIAGKERGSLGELDWPLMRERDREREWRSALSVCELVWTETLYAYRDTCQAGIIFSSMCISVNFCNFKVHQKLKFWHRAPEEDGKQRHLDIHQKLVCSSRSYYIKSWDEPRWSEKNLCLLQSQLTQVCKWRVYVFPLYA